MCVPILRPKTFLGPGRMGLFAMLFEWAEEGRNFPVLGRGDVRIQMLAVEDLVDARGHRPDRAARRRQRHLQPRPPPEFGTLREDFQAVLDAAGHGRRVVSLPARPALAALRLLERTRLSPVYGRLVHKLLADSYVSTDKARERLGFQPRCPTRTRFSAPTQWWREQRARATPASAPAGPAATPASRGRCDSQRCSSDGDHN